MEDIDEKEKNLLLEIIDVIKKKILEILEEVQLIEYYVDDFDDIDKAMADVEFRVFIITESINTDSIDTKNFHGKKKNSIPDNIANLFSSLKRLSKFTTTMLENKKLEYQKARAIRIDYTEALDVVAAYLLKAQVQLQENSSNPETLLDGIKILLSEISPVKSKLDLARRNGLLIVEKTKKAEKKQFILKSISSIEDQMNKVESWLYEREVQLKDALNALGQLLESLYHIHKWIQNTEILQLQDAKQKLLDLQKFSKVCTQVPLHPKTFVRKRLEEMSEVCSSGDFADIIDNIIDRSTDYRLQEQVTLLQELVEEWECCETKIKEVATKFYESDFKKSSSRDQLIVRKKMMLDLSVHKKTVLTILEELQFHLRSPIYDQYRISAGEQSFQGEIKTFNCEVGEQCELLLVQDQHQQGLQSQKHSASQVEHQLKLADNPSVDVEKKEKVKKLQQITPSEEIHSSTEKYVFKGTILKSESQRQGKPFAESPTSDLQFVNECFPHQNYPDQSTSSVDADKLLSSPSYQKQRQVNSYATSVKSGSIPANYPASRVLKEIVSLVSRKEQSKKFKSSSTTVLSQANAAILDKNVTGHFSTITSHGYPEVTHKRSTRTQLNPNASSSSKNSDTESLVSASGLDSFQRVLSAQSSQTSLRCSFIQNFTETDKFTSMLPENADATAIEMRQTFTDFKESKTVHSKEHAKATEISSETPKQSKPGMADPDTLSATEDYGSTSSHIREYCSPHDTDSNKIRGVEYVSPVLVRTGKDKAVHMRQQRKLQTQFKQEFSSITADSKSSTTHVEVGSEFEDRSLETGQLFEKLESSMPSEQSSQMSFIQHSKLRDSITDTLVEAEGPPCSTAKGQTITGLKNKKTALTKTRVRPSVVQRLFKTQMSAFDAKVAYAEGNADTFSTNIEDLHVLSEIDFNTEHGSSQKFPSAFELKYVDQRKPPNIQKYN